MGAFLVASTAAVGIVLGGIVLFACMQLRRRGLGAVDRASRGRIDARMASLVQGAAPTPIDGITPEAEGRGSRRRLWQDTSIVLVLVGLGVVAVQVMQPIGPTGGVLQATGTPATAASEERATATDAPRSTHRPTAVATSHPSSTPPPSRSPAASSAPGAGSKDRLAVLEPCPGRAGCYLYTVRRGDNLFSIAHWFGIPLDTVLRLNPGLRAPASIYAGQVLVLPPPTR